MHEQRAVPAVFPAIERFFASCEAERGEIAPERLRALDEIASGLTRALDGPRHSEMIVVFVCTHNSRRSHIAHAVFASAMMRQGMMVQSGSAGTEATAFNPSAVQALQRIGFGVSPIDPAGRDQEHGNPVYALRLSETHQPILAFSKTLGHEQFRDALLFAVMVCDHADRFCPSVPGAIGRYALPFVDPKAGDGTPDEAAGYDACVRTIGREMIYLANTIAAP